MKTFYFTNPTDDRHRSREIQLLIEKETGLVLDNPFYDKTGKPTDEIKALDNGEKPKISHNEIVDRDLEMIDNSDGLVAFITDKTSWGSIQECFYASRVIKRPTYIICDPKTRSKINNPNHPWVLRNSTKVFGTLEGFIAFAKEKLNGE